MRLCRINIFRVATINSKNVLRTLLNTEKYIFLKPPGAPALPSSGRMDYSLAAGTGGSPRCTGAEGPFMMLLRGRVSQAVAATRAGRCPARSARLRREVKCPSGAQAAKRTSAGAHGHTEVPPEAEPRGPVPPRGGHGAGRRGGAVRQGAPGAGGARRGPHRERGRGARSRCDFDS